MKSLSEFLPLLASPKRISISHHNNPDADATGSALALSHYLTLKGHHCVVFSPNEVPDYLDWMPGRETVMVFEGNEVACSARLSESEIHFSLDYNNFSRTKSMEKVLTEYTGTRVLIDHHMFPADYFDYGLSLTSKSSTCEMIYDFIALAGDTHLINLAIAECLYSGTMTDTGGFRFAGTTPNTHRMVASFLELGLEPARIHTALFDNYSENRLLFMGWLFAEKMQVFADMHTAIIAVSEEELKRFNISTGDTEGIVNFPLSIKPVIFSTFITQRQKEIRMSFRSQGDFNVNEFARTWFEGGGHRNASGGRGLDSIEATVARFMEGLKQNESQLKLCFRNL
ncbi:MAG: bifunctional oligoribonuclease/PAP phosphatase NrnA [Chitinophagaceae bacterium]|nr:bifunctional oligoribonuclease/PAP phosphatase NrnA [Chitinophagaceae bacterium]